MGRNGQKDQILDSVIVLLAVLVMNRLPPLKLSVEMTLHHKSMLVVVSLPQNVPDVDVPRFELGHI